MQDVNVYIVSHKVNKLDLPDYCSLIQVNAAKNQKWDNCLHDDDYAGNISKKNNSYCELTALHHMWKTSEADIIGLFHYRRYFSGKTKVCLENETDRFCTLDNLKKKIITKEKIKELLTDSDIILALPNCPYPVTAIEDLQRFISIDDINKMIDVIQTYYPTYSKTLLDVLCCMNLSYCNMFIARKKLIDDYCEWLFDVLGKIEPLIPVEKYDVQHQRIFGYYAEVLLNVYVIYNKWRRKYVYKLDMVEDTGVKLRHFRINQTMNYVKAIFGVYPRYKWDKLLKARYKVMRRFSMLSKCTLDDSFRSPDKYINFIKNVGARNISLAEEGSYSIIIATFMEVVVVSYFVSDKNSLYNIFDEIERNRTVEPFGYSKVYRVWINNSNEEIDPELLSKGIISNIAIDKTSKG